MKTHNILVIDTDSYSGNFEREMTGWILGHNDFDNMYDKGYSKRVREEHPELSEYFDFWEANSSYHIFDEEYGEQICGIMTTPGYSNNGSGVHTKLEPGELMKWPSYQSVGIAVNKLPDQNILTIMKMLVEEFAASKNITIIGYRFLTETVTTTSTELEL